MAAIMPHIVPDGMVGPLSALAEDKLLKAKSENDVYIAAIANGEIGAVVCAVPWSMDQHKTFLQSEYGGYLGYLDSMGASEDLLTRKFMLAITYGNDGSETWFNLAILKVDGEVLPLVLPGDLMSDKDAKDINEKYG